MAYNEGRRRLAAVPLACITIWGLRVLAETLSVIQADSALWQAARPLVDVALRLEQNDAGYVWHGWSKNAIERFLKALPRHCALLVSVWEQAAEDEQETLYLACACEVQHGEVISIRCLDALEGPDLPPLAQLEPGFQHALALMRAVKSQIAPVAWALFTDRSTWEEWLLSSQEGEGALDKAELLASLAQQGRCVVLGNGQVNK